MSVDPKTFRASVRRDRAARTIARYKARTLLSVCDLAERRDRHLGDIRTRVPFMGLGELRPVLADPDDGDGDWFFVHEVIAITGASAEQWHQLHDEEIEEAAEEPAVLPRVDEYTNHRADGGTHQVPVCNWQMALMLALEGPWGEEMMANAMPAFRRAAIESGIADQIDVVRIAEDGTAHYTGESMAEAIRAEGPLPSAEVVREQIRRGPLGAFTDQSGR
ncbi:hypothetical protein [Streptomyces prunicolor]|uniref:Uncharacterized protein n=1 Tax=Streptomyces prunicolor TaxID=67348 RepID=A0ABU4FKD0_9ACTN|nr:hypothetical protein [Streptomyces prunicolor]MDV7221009.1 hypothetical protein [Streptomyces prunicolor]